MRDDKIITKTNLWKRTTNVSLLVNHTTIPVGGEVPDEYLWMVKQSLGPYLKHDIAYKLHQAGFKCILNPDDMPDNMNNGLVVWRAPVGSEVLYVQAKIVNHALFIDYFIDKGGKFVIPSKSLRIVPDEFKTLLNYYQESKNREAKPSIAGMTTKLVREFDPNKEKTKWEEEIKRAYYDYNYIMGTDPVPKKKFKDYSEVKRIEENLINATVVYPGVGFFEITLEEDYFPKKVVLELVKDDKLSDKALRDKYPILWATTYKKFMLTLVDMKLSEDEKEMLAHNAAFLVCASHEV